MLGQVVVVLVRLSTDYKHWGLVDLELAKTDRNSCLVRCLETFPRGVHFLVLVAGQGIWEGKIGTG